MLLLPIQLLDMGGGMADGAEEPPAAPGARRDGGSGTVGQPTLAIGIRIAISSFVLATLRWTGVR